MEKYKCDVCGENHDYYGSFPILSLPDIIKQMTDTEKENLEKMHDFFYHLEGDSFFCKANLYIKVKGRDWFVHWEAWTRIEEADFYSLPKELKINQNYRVKAKLISPIFHYDDSLNTLVNLIVDFEDKNSYPEIEPIIESSELSQDFLSGISIDKLQKWMRNIYHPELIESNNLA